MEVGNLVSKELRLFKTVLNFKRNMTGQSSFINNSQKNENKLNSPIKRVTQFKKTKHADYKKHFTSTYPD